MIASELIQLGREKYLDDWQSANPAGQGHDTGQLWTDAVLLSGLNWAQRKAADWALLLRDKTTQSVCSLELASGQTDYALSRKIVKVKAIVWTGSDGATVELKPVNRGMAENLYGSDWRTRVGQPMAYIPEGYSIRLLPAPDAELDGTTLTLDVFRLPLANMTLNDEPEIDEANQEDLLYGMVWQACLLRDVETANLGTLAAIHKSHFLEIFGPEVTATVRMSRLHDMGSFIIQTNLNPEFITPSLRRLW